MLGDAARQVRETLCQKVVALQKEIASVQSAIASIDAQLSIGLPGEGERSQNEDQRSARSKKGENTRSITSYLRAVHVLGATIAEISNKTGIAKTSCTAVLQRHKEVFAKGDDGKWRLRPEQLSHENKNERSVNGPNT